MAIDTIISNDELVVVGPPASVSVSVDVGPQGERGSQFYYGVGLPTAAANAASLVDARINDLYINSELGGNYGTVYKLNAIPGGTAWQGILKFQPLSYSIQEPVDFVSGSGSISIPLADFYPNASENLSSDTILIQATAELNNPAFISISNKSIQEISTVKTFIAELKGAQFSSGSVSLISASAVPINFYITAGAGA
jgi:S-formylglutathione hydrolase FrmB